MWGAHGGGVGFGRTLTHESFTSLRRPLVPPVEKSEGSTDLDGQPSRGQSNHSKTVFRSLVPLPIDRPYHGNQHIRPPSYRAYDSAGRLRSEDYTGTSIDITESLS